MHDTRYRNGYGNVRRSLELSLEPLLAVELMWPIESMITAPYQVQERVLCLIMATARPAARRLFHRAATVMSPAFKDVETVKVEVALIRWRRRANECMII